MFMGRSNKESAEAVKGVSRRGCKFAFARHQRSGTGNGRSKKAHMLAAAIAAVLLMGALSGCQLTNTPPSDSYIIESSAECIVPDADLEYTVVLDVTVNKSGQVYEIQDAGTVIPDDKTAKFEKAKETLFESLKGADLSTIDDVDIVSGATASSEAIIEAVRSALEDAEYSDELESVSSN